MPAKSTAESEGKSKKKKKKEEVTGNESSSLAIKTPKQLE
jgi:hypothetical protein